MTCSVVLSLPDTCRCQEACKAVLLQICVGAQSTAFAQEERTCGQKGNGLTGGWKAKGGETSEKVYRLLC